MKINILVIIKTYLEVMSVLIIGCKVLLTQSCMAAEVRLMVRAIQYIVACK